MKVETLLMVALCGALASLMLVVIVRDRRSVMDALRRTLRTEGNELRGTLLFACLMFVVMIPALALLESLGVPREATFPAMLVSWFLTGAFAIRLTRRRPAPLHTVSIVHVVPPGACDFYLAQCDDCDWLEVDRPPEELFRRARRHSPNVRPEMEEPGPPDAEVSRDRGRPRRGAAL